MRKLTLLLPILLFLAGLNTYAQFGEPEPFAPLPAEDEKPAVTAELVSSAKAVKPGTTFQLGVLFKMGPKWHIYGKQPGDAGFPTEIKWTLPDGVTLEGDLFYPPDIGFETPMGEGEPPIKSRGYEGEVVLIQTFRVAENATLGNAVIKAKATWLGCKVQCVPGDADLEWKGALAANTETDEAGQKLIQTWLSKASTAEGPPQAQLPVTPSIPLVRIILMALVFGLIMNLMPCVWPVLSIKIVSFVEQSGEGRKAWHHGLAFALGIIFTFLILAGIVLGVRRGGEELGWGFQLSSPTFVALLTFLMFLLGLNFFGVFEFGTGLAGVSKGRKSGLVGSFMSGMLATIVATPCTGPFMGLYIGYALTQPAIVVILFFLLLGVGMGIPYLLLTSFPGLLKKIPKPGRWMETLKQGMGFILMIYVVFLIYTVSSLSGNDGAAWLLFGLVVAGIAAWVLGRWATFEYTARTRLIVRGVFVLILGAGIAVALGAKTWLKSPVDWQPYDAEQVKTETAAGKPVFVSFTATWCTTCKTNKVAFTKSVARRFNSMNVVPMVADYTEQPPELKALLKTFGRQSVPFYLLYPGDPSKPPIVLPEVLTPGVVQGALDKLETQK